MCKLFVLDKTTWYPLTVQKTLKHKNVKINAIC